jgi:large subunit ribosomal protein L5
MQRIQLYKDSILNPDLALRSGTLNLNDLPSLKKLVLNTSVSNLAQDKKKLLYAMSSLTLVSGQRAIATKAKKSIATFKLKEGAPIGCKVTLTGLNMFRFIEKLIWVVLPSIKDLKEFRRQQVSNKNSYSIGLRDINLFPESKALSEKLYYKFGVDITFSFKSSDVLSTLVLISSLGIPYKKG